MRHYCALLLLPFALHAQTLVGAHGTIGAPAGAKVVSRLQITQPGVYENLIIDGDFAPGNLVKITADNVTLRNCEIRHSSGNGIGVFGTKVVIENCRIHHLLNGSFDDQQDAHGISGRWGDVMIRNCDISHPSGDCIQFDPDRKSSGTVVIENCTLWTGPLKADMAGFKAGQRRVLSISPLMTHLSNLQAMKALWRWESVFQQLISRRRVMLADVFKA